MIYVPIKYLKPDMILARSVFLSSLPFPLLVAGQAISNKMIVKFNEYEIEGAYIESRLGSDIEMSDLIDPQMKQKTLADLKSIFEDCIRQKPIAICTVRSVSKIAEELITNILSKEECIFNMIDLKDFNAYTYSHSMYVGILCALIGIRMGFSYSKLYEITMAGLLHDIGKQDIPVEIIEKTEALTPEEFEIMKLHPELGVKRLRPCCAVSAAVLQGIASHHERYDGTGYPRGICGKKIPVYGRILAIADVYDALTSSRSYRKAWSSSEAVEFIMGGIDTHFDQDIMHAFLRSVAAYPVGMLVHLSNGELAMVTQNLSQNILRPMIELVMPEERRGVKINLSEDITYLNVTITDVLKDSIDLPQSLF